MPDGDLHGGGCLFKDYELRITARCLRDDLALRAEASFAEALAHPIVKAFRAKRADSPTGSKLVGPAAGGSTLYRLGIGNDHRGATWYEESDKVVWLCAYGLHRSGEPDDAFQIFLELIKSREIYPNQADDRRLLAERDRRFAELAPEQAAGARSQAIACAGTSVEFTLGHPLGTCVKVRAIAEVADDLVELSIAFVPAGMTATSVYSIPALFMSESPEAADSFAGSPLAPDEVGFKLLFAV